MEIESPDGSYSGGYTPLAEAENPGGGIYPASSGHPSSGTSCQPLSYGTTDYQPVVFAPQQEDQGYASQAGYFQKTVMMCQPKSHTIMMNTVPDNMSMAIFTTVCCCWPLGLVAILRAQESRRALQQGDMLSASVFSAESRRFSLWAIAGGVFCLVVSIVIIVVIIRLNYDY